MAVKKKQLSSVGGGMLMYRRSFTATGSATTITFSCALIHAKLVCNGLDSSAVQKKQLVALWG